MPNRKAKSLADRLEKLVEAARKEGRDVALAEVRGLIGGKIPVPTKRVRPKGSKNEVTASAPAAKPRKRRKTSWAPY